MENTFAPHLKNKQQEDFDKRSFHFWDNGNGLFVLTITNTLLTLLTLGIYGFWARVNVKKFLYNNTEVLDSTFDYHTTGAERFQGALQAFGVMFIIGISLFVLVVGATFVFMFLGLPKEELEYASEKVGSLMYAMTYFMLLPYFRLGKKRFLLNRSSWRNVRFSFRGELRNMYVAYMSGTLPALLILGLVFPIKASLDKYQYVGIPNNIMMVLAIGGIFLLIFTIGFLIPFRTYQLRKFEINNSYFGSMRFQFFGSVWEMINIQLIGALLTVLSLGLYAPWWRANVHNYYWSHTALGQTQLEGRMTGSALLEVHLVSFLIVIATLGFGIPYAVVRHRTLQMNSIAFVETPSLEEIERATDFSESAMFDGFDDIADVSDFMGGFFS